MTETRLDEQIEIAQRELAVTTALREGLQNHIRARESRARASSTGGQGGRASADVEALRRDVQVGLEQLDQSTSRRSAVEEALIKVEADADRVASEVPQLQE